MNLKNISRDAFWLPSIKYADSINWSTNTVGLVNSDGVAHSDIAAVIAGNAAGSTGTQGIGVFMDPPKNEYVPYRVKAHVDASAGIHLMIGYAPASITGNDDALAQYHFIPFEYEMDEIFMLPALASGDTYYNRPICFGIATQGATTSRCFLSVQKLDVVPPQFSVSVP
jgi:hypothetical protein